MLQVASDSHAQKPWQEVRASLDRDAWDFIYVSCDDRNMEPTIRRGDHLFVKVLKKFDRDGVYVLNFDNDLVVMRARRNKHNGLVTLTNDRDKSGSGVLIKKSDLEALKCIARVVAIGSDVI